MEELYSGRTKYGPSMAERYARRNPKRNAEEARVLEALLGGLPAGGKVLDVPCGAGRIAKILSHRGFHVTCGDLSADMVAAAGRSLDSAIPRLRADLLHLPFADQSFDHAFAIRIFHHLPTPEIRIQALRELSRVARQKVILTFFHPISLHSARRWIQGKLTGRPSRRARFGTKTLAAEAGEAGLEVELTRGLRPYLKDLWFAVLRASHRT